MEKFPLGKSIVGCINPFIRGGNPLSVFKIKVYSKKSIINTKPFNNLYSFYTLTNMKAVIYARVSSTTDRQTTDRQVNDLMQYAAANQMQVIKIFEEKISGAKQNKERQVLQETLEYCRQEKVDYLLSNELSRIGRNTFNVLETIKFLIDNNINLYLQKEKFTLLQDNGKPSPFAAIMLATLSTCAELERENIAFRLQSGRKQFIDKGGKLGRKEGSYKSIEQKKEEYAEVLRLLRKGISIRNVAKLSNVGISTVQRLKKEFEIA